MSQTPPVCPDCGAPLLPGQLCPCLGTIDPPDRSAPWDEAAASRAALRTVWGRLTVQSFLVRTLKEMLAETIAWLDPRYNHASANWSVEALTMTLEAAKRRFTDGKQKTSGIQSRGTEDRQTPGGVRQAGVCHAGGVHPQGQCEGQAEEPTAETREGLASLVCPFCSPRPHGLSTILDHTCPVCESPMKLRITADVHEAPVLHDQ